jgi:hypothetical protein
VRDERLHRARQQHVIGIEEDHKLTMACEEAGIQRRTLSAVLLQDRDDAVAVARDYLPRVIC